MTADDVAIVHDALSVEAGRQLSEAGRLAVLGLDQAAAHASGMAAAYANSADLINRHIGVTA